MNKVIFEEHQEGVIFALTWTANDELLSLGYKNNGLVLANTKTGEVIMNMNEFEK